MAQVALQRTDDRTEALREIVSSSLAWRSHANGSQPRCPDLASVTTSARGIRLSAAACLTSTWPRPMARLRVYRLLRNARPVLLDLGAPGSFDAARWQARVASVFARYDGAWELPALGLVSAPTAVLVRPDGYVAWVGEGRYDGLEGALNTWFRTTRLAQSQEKWKTVLRPELPKNKDLEGRRRLEETLIRSRCPRRRSGRPIDPFSRLPENAFLVGPAVLCRRRTMRRDQLGMAGPQLLDREVRAEHQSVAARECRWHRRRSVRSAPGRCGARRCRGRRAWRRGSAPGRSVRRPLFQASAVPASSPVSMPHGSG